MNPSNESPDLSNEPTKPTPNESSIPRPRDAWPAEQNSTGDVEPATQPAATTVGGDTVTTAVPPTEEPAAATPAVAPLGSQTRTGKKKPLMIVLIIVGVLVLLAAAAAGAYAWYQNPNKVVTDSFGKILTAKSLAYTAVVDSKSDTTKMTINVDGASTTQEVSGHAKATITMGAASVNVEGNVVSDKDGNMYIKIVNAKDIATTFLQEMPAQLRSSVDAAVAKINDKWIKITPADLDSTTTDANKVQQCYRTALDKLNTDAAYRSELTDLYNKQQFITIKQNLGTVNGSFGYKLAVDTTKEKAFIDGVQHTKLYADLQKCDSSFKLDSADITKETTGSSHPDVEVWIDQWSHTLTKLVISSPATETADTYKVTVNTKFDQKVTIDVPKDAMTLDQLKSELAPIFGNMFSSEAEATATSMETMPMTTPMEAPVAPDMSALQMLR